MENDYFIDIKTVLDPPIKMNFIDFIYCPCCVFEIYIFGTFIDNNSYVYCENCNLKIGFKIVKI